VVPVLRNADTMSFAGVEGAIASYGREQDSNHTCNFHYMFITFIEHQGAQLLFAHGVLTFRCIRTHLPPLRSLAWPLVP